MTPEAWTFFSAQSLGIITLISQQLDAKRKSARRAATLNGIRKCLVSLDDRVKNLEKGSE